MNASPIFTNDGYLADVSLPDWNSHAMHVYNNGFAAGRRDYFAGIDDVTASGGTGSFGQYFRDGYGNGQRHAARSRA